MRTPPIAILLCVLATAAGAEDMTRTPAPAEARQATASAKARPKVELIQPAGAATNDEPGMRPSPRKHSPVETDEHDHPGGLAMLLAGLALMLGIALRRLGTRDQ